MTKCNATAAFCPIVLRFLCVVVYACGAQEVPPGNEIKLEDAAADSKDGVATLDGRGEATEVQVHDVAMEVGLKDALEPQKDGAETKDLDTPDEDVDEDPCQDCGIEAICTLDGECVPMPELGECSTGWCSVHGGEFQWGQTHCSSCLFGGPTSNVASPRTFTLTYALLVQQLETTQADWQAVRGTEPSYFSDCGDACPVERVSWYDAAWYCNQLSARQGLNECYELTECEGSPGTGCEPGASLCQGDFHCRELEVISPTECDGYRLPTNTEWEFLARAGTVEATYSGSVENCHMCAHEPVLDEIAWYCANADGKPHPGGQKTPNQWQLFDMLGNVMEWTDGRVEDNWALDTVDPVSEWGNTFFRLYEREVRGGSWWLAPRYATAYSRLGLEARSRHRQVGFRVVRTRPEE